MKGITVCRIREILYAEHIVIVCIGGEIQYEEDYKKSVQRRKIQCADEEKCSVQRSTNSLFRGVQIQCSEEYKYSVQKRRNTVCLGVRIECAEK